jgi:hypothetical protein
VVYEGLKRRTIARGVLPLHCVVAAHGSDINGCDTINVDVALESGTAALGMCSVGLRVEGRSSSTILSMHEAVRRMRSLAGLSWSHDHNNREPEPAPKTAALFSERSGERKRNIVMRRVLDGLHSAQARLAHARSV